MVKPFYYYIFLLFVLTSCLTDKKQNLTIAAAANTQYAMGEIKESFEQETGQPVTLIFGSSGKLTAQIVESAPYDIFISADMKYPQSLFEKGLALEAPGIYAKGALVLWTFDPELYPDLEVLRSEKVKKIAMANPQTAPYGVASEEVLRNAGLYEKLVSKLVFGESIAQTNQYLSTQAAEIGFTAKSVVLSKEMEGKGRWLDIDPGHYSAIEQGAVILKVSEQRNAALARQFYDFLFSEQAQEIFKKYGYLVPK